jgi:Cytochrome P460
MAPRQVLVAAHQNVETIKRPAHCLSSSRGLPPEQIAKLLAGSTVAGNPTNVQFMTKDSKKYASTGGWGFAQFTNGKPGGTSTHLRLSIPSGRIIAVNMLAEGTTLGPYELDPLELGHAELASSSQTQGSVVPNVPRLHQNSALVSAA